MCVIARNLAGAHHSHKTRIDEKKTITAELDGQKPVENVFLKDSSFAGTNEKGESLFRVMDVTGGSSSSGDVSIKCENPVLKQVKSDAIAVKMTYTDLSACVQCIWEHVQDDSCLRLHIAQPGYDSAPHLRDRSSLHHLSRCSEVT